MSIKCQIFHGVCVFIFMFWDMVGLSKPPPELITETCDKSTSVSFISFILRYKAEIIFVFKKRVVNKIFYTSTRVDSAV